MDSFDRLWVTVLDMRWDRLFADLEGEAARLAKVEIETVAAELGDEAWGQTSWRRLLGGRVELEVRGAGRVSGEVASVNEVLIRLRGDTGDRLVATSSVLEIVDSEHRSDPPGRVEAALGWPSALRRLRDAGEDVRVTGDDGRVVTGRIDAVGQDFVRIVVESGRRRIVLLDAVAMIAGLR